MKGKVKFYNVKKGFGFLISDDDSKEYFVHLTGLNPGVRLNENDAVTFDVEDGERGPKAVNVSLEGQSSEPAATEDAADSEDF